MERLDTNCTFAEYAISRSSQVRDQLIRDHLGLTYFVAKGFLSSGLDLEELAAMGVTGLIRAVERFDPERGYRFSTFAVPHIRGSIQRDLAKTQQLIHGQPRHISIASLDAEPADDGSATLGEQIADERGLDPHAHAELGEARDELREALAHLSCDERVVIALRFGFTGSGPIRRAAIADQLGVSPERVQTLETRALRQIRTAVSRLGLTA